MKMGWIKPRRPKDKEEEEDPFYQLWKDDDQVRGSGSGVPVVRLHLDSVFVCGYMRQ